MMQFITTSFLLSVAIFTVIMIVITSAEPKTIIKVVGNKTTDSNTKNSISELLRRLDYKISSELFLGIRNTGAFLFLLSALLVFPYNNKLFFFFLFLSLVIYIFPSMILRARDKKRIDDIQSEFPKMVTLTRVYSKMGDLYRAFTIVRYALKGELKKQMDLFAAELEIYPLSRALDNLAQRCNYPPLTNFVSVMLVGITTGADVDQILDTFAQRAYQDRKNEITMKIKKRPIVMTIIPMLMVLCLLMIFAIPLYSNIIDKLSKL